MTPYPPLVEVFALANDTYRLAAGYDQHESLQSPTFPDLSLPLLDVFGFPIDPDEHVQVVREARGEYAPNNSAFPPTAPRQLPTAPCPLPPPDFRLVTKWPGCMLRHMDLEAGPDLAALKQFFADQPGVLLAFLFGSAATNRRTHESDIDIGVFLQDSAEEDRIWRALTRHLQAEVDLVRLDQAPASLVSAILKQGLPLVIRDRGLYLDLMLDQTMEAEDFAEFARDFHAIARRSASLSPEDETRVLERIQFLDGEMTELEHFRSITADQYENDKATKRNLERWAENIINATIDIAKLVLAAEHRPMPRTYQQALESLALLAGVEAEQAQQFASHARLRNLLAHEYLAILYERIGSFIKDFPPVRAKISAHLQTLLTPTDPPPESP